MGVSPSPRSMFSFRKNDKGFTLIEVMVVVIILGILLTIAIGLLLDMRERTYIATIRSDLGGAFETALDFHTTTPGATATLDDLRDHGFRESLNITITVVDGNLDTLKITATHVAVSGIYQIDHNGQISQQ